MNANKFQFIYKYLYHSSLNSKDIFPEQHAYLFSLGDGYGRMTEEQLRQKGLIWDFSHIRDSSDEALENIYKALKNIIYEKQMKEMGFEISK